MKYVDRFIDGISMYWLVKYDLIMLLSVAVILSITHHLSYNPVAVILSALYLVVVCGGVNILFARLFAVPSNQDSSYITGLILALIITPVLSLPNLLFVTMTGTLAIASKYLLTINHRHIFNPAAIAVVLTAFGAGTYASWWVDNTLLLPFVVLGGLIVARKIRRVAMVLTFVGAATSATFLINLVVGNDAPSSINSLLLHSSVFFLGTIMLTEPLTTPPKTDGRTWYAILAGALFPPQMHILSIYSTPELALAVANVFSYIISPKIRLLPRLKEKFQIASDIMDFTFVPDHAFAYQPGQYVEVTVPHPHVDMRGRRRYFTLASSPTEAELRIGVKFYPNGSSYKKALLTMGRDIQCSISPPAGDFILPEDTAEKLVFIAGGIGVTPFRSIIKYLVDTKQRRDAVFFYAEKTPDELVYREIFEQARKQIGLRVTYVVSTAPPRWNGLTGRVTAPVIAQTVPDYKDRTFYISGPLGLVTGLRDSLHELGIPPQRIKTDYFPGYV